MGLARLRSCGGKLWGCLRAEFTRLWKWAWGAFTRLALAVAICLFALESGQLLELPIQCNYDPGCYSGVFQKVVGKCLSLSISKCLQTQWQHAVTDTQARETNILSVCWLDESCWYKYCPDLSQATWKTVFLSRSCLLYGHQVDTCATNFVPMTVADVDSACRMRSDMGNPSRIDFKMRLKSSNGTKPLLSALYQQHCKDSKQSEHVEAFLAKEVQQMDNDKDGYVTAEECKSYASNFVVQEHRAILLGSPGAGTPELCNAFAGFGSFEAFGAFQASSKSDRLCPLKSHGPGYQPGRWTLVDVPLVSSEWTEAIQTELRSDRDSEGNQVSYQNRLVLIVDLQQGNVTEKDQAAMRTILLEITKSFGVIVVDEGGMDAAMRIPVETQIENLSQSIHIYWFESGDVGLDNFMEALPSVDVGDVKEWVKKDIGNINRDLKRSQFQIYEIRSRLSQCQEKINKLQDKVNELEEQNHMFQDVYSKIEHLQGQVHSLQQQLEMYRR